MNNLHSYLSDIQDTIRALDAARVILLNEQSSADKLAQYAQGISQDISRLIGGSAQGIDSAAIRTMNNVEDAARRLSYDIFGVVNSIIEQGKVLEYKASQIRDEIARQELAEES